MRRRRRTLGDCLVRSLAGAGLVYALVMAYVVPVGLAAGSPQVLDPVHPGDSTAPGTRPDRVTWAPALERRFPDCGDMADWSGEDVPTTVVVARQDGTLDRMRFDLAYSRARSAPGVVRIIGACD